VNPGIVKIAAIKLAKYGIVYHESLGWKMYIPEYMEWEFECANPGTDDHRIG
jgi:hypothetical protein